MVSLGIFGVAGVVAAALFAPYPAATPLRFSFARIVADRPQVDRVVAGIGALTEAVASRHAAAERT